MNGLWKAFFLELSWKRKRANNSMVWISLAVWQWEMKVDVTVMNDPLASCTCVQTQINWHCCQTQLWRAETSDEPSNMVNGSLNSSLTGKRRFGHVIFSLLPILKIPITQHLQLTRQGLLPPTVHNDMQTVKSEEITLKPRLIALVIFNDFEMYWPHYGTVQLSIPLIRWCAPIEI